MLRARPRTCSNALGRSGGGRGPALLLLGTLLLVPALVGCGCGPPNTDSGTPPPILFPEPACAPADTVTVRWFCVGNITPDKPPASLTLTGWMRTLADPGDDAPVFTNAQAVVFDTDDSTELVTGFPDMSDGRVAVGVPIRVEEEGGWLGSVLVTADGYKDYYFKTSRVVFNTDYSTWIWMTTDAEMTTLAGDVGETIDPTKGALVGAVHDCDGLGAANAVVKWGDSTDDVVYFDAFAPDTDPSRCYTHPSGRFAIANVDPGPIVIEAYGRLEAGGDLVLLSTMEMTVTADAINSAGLQPRVGNQR